MDEPEPGPRPAPDRLPTWALLPMFRSGPYKPVELLGSGGQGIVLRAHRSDLDRSVVVKLLRRDPDPQKQLEARFLREARILARIRHPNVLELLDFGCTPETAYMVYPDDRGVSLDVLLRQRSDRCFPEAEIRPMLDQILAGLEAIHGVQVVHRDLKPANLLVTPGGGLRILDLGLASALPEGEELTRTGTVLGTPAYMAPDQLQGLETHPADDLYSVGILGYELAAGKNPFRGADLGEILDRHLASDPPRLDSVAPVSAGYAAFIHRMLAKTRRARPASASEARALLAGTGEAWPPSLDGTAPVATIELPRIPSGATPTPTPTPRGRPGGERWSGSLLLSRVISGALGTPSGKRPWVAGAAAILVLAGLFWPDRSPSPDPRGAVDPAPAPVPEPVATVFPGLARRVAAAVRDWQDRLERGDGRIGRGDEDPLAWGEGPGSLPPVREVLEWLASGGRPETLGSGDLAELADADGRMLEAGLPSAFDFLSDLVPSPVTVELNPEEGKPRYGSQAYWGDWRRPAPGWAGRVVLEGRKLFEGALATEEWIRRPQEDGSPLAATSIAMMQALAHRSPDNPTPMVTGIFDVFIASPEGRKVVAPVLGPAHRAWRRMLYAAARSLSEEPETRVLVLAMLDDLTLSGPHKVGRLGISTGLPLRLQLVGFPATPEGHAARMLAARAVRQTRSICQGRDAEAEAYLQEATPSVIATPGDGRVARMLRFQAAWIGGETFDFPDRVPGIPVALSALLDATVRLDPRERQGLVHVFLAQSCRDPGALDSARRLALEAVKDALVRLLAGPLPSLGQELARTWPALPMNLSGPWFGVPPPQD